VVDLVRAGVAEILTLEIDPRAAALLAESRRMVEWRRAAGVVAEQLGETLLELPVALRRTPRPLQLDQRRHECLGDEAAAEASEVAQRVRELRLHRTPFASATKRQTLSGSLRPGCASTPEFTSTPYGRTVATARATFSGVRPAERMMRQRWLAQSRASAHSIASPGSPSLHRAVLSRSRAAARLR